MKKIIRLTESDLVKLVKKVIQEQNSTKKITIVTPGKNIVTGKQIGRAHV